MTRHWHDQAQLAGNIDAQAIAQAIAEAEAEGDYGLADQVRAAARAAMAPRSFEPRTSFQREYSSAPTQARLPEPDPLDALLARYAQLRRLAGTPAEREAIALLER